MILTLSLPGVFAKIALFYPHLKKPKLLNLFDEAWFHLKVPFFFFILLYISFSYLHRTFFLYPHENLHEMESNDFSENWQNRHNPMNQLSSQKKSCHCTRVSLKLFTNDSQIKFKCQKNVRHCFGPTPGLLNVVLLFVCEIHGNTTQRGTPQD